MPHVGSERGSALVTVMLLMALLMTLLVGYFTLTFIDTSATRMSVDSSRGFYAAEAGLNLRAGGLRDSFQGFDLPAGSSPSNPSDLPCEGGDTGAGDFSCTTYVLDSQTVRSYVEEDAGNPTPVVIPRGERFQNMSALEYSYHVGAHAKNPRGRVEAVLEMELKSRLIPLFQFAAFYDKDLEILPGPSMSLNGPVHANGDLYLASGASLDIDGQVSAEGAIYRGRKDSDSCAPGDVSVADPGALTALPSCVGSRETLDPSQLTAWNGMVRPGAEPLTAPPPESLDPDPGELYWDRADLRVVLDLTGGTPVIEVRQADGQVDATRSANLAACGTATHGNTLYNQREGTSIDMLDVDLVGLLDCSHIQLLLDDNRALDDTTDDGLVIYLGVTGPDAATTNNYGVRIRNGAEIASNAIGAPAVHGLTIVTNQAIYLQGDFNTVDKKPAAVIADSLNLLSNAWNDANSALPLSSRIASSTAINAAFLAGTDSTGGAEGAGGRDGGGYNGGLENFPRLHEDWTGKTLAYRGSFVSLSTPRHAAGPWSSQSYSAPTRDWDYDVDFNDPTRLPPLTPRFVYLRQDLFVRQFEL